MIRFLIALLLAGYVLCVPIEPEIKLASEVSTPAPTENLDATKTPAQKTDSDLETEPSVWFSYHHSIHSAPPPPLIIHRPRVYASYYADYAPYYSYWNTW